MFKRLTYSAENSKNELTKNQSLLSTSKKQKKNNAPIKNRHNQPKLTVKEEERLIPPIAFYQTALEY